MEPDFFGESSSGSVEPPHCDAVEVDPTGRYIRYKEILGRGAFKTVYKAFDDVDGMEVAWNLIKIEDVLQSKGDVERVHSEVQLLKQLKHEHIMKFCSSWIDQKEKTINIITELFSSGSLRQYRLKHKKVDMKVIKRWAKQILSGLNYLHSHQPPIIHRDLKCDNIFINGNRGEIKLGDLGFATIMQQSNCRSVIGTPEFMAPELYDEQYNELVDIYSFGMCILELVTFEYPYSECRNSAQIFKKVSTGVKPAALAKVNDPEVIAFIEKCIAPADKRFSAKALLMDPFLQTDVLPQLLSDTSGGRHIHPEADFLKDDEPEVITILNNDVDGSPIQVVVQKSLHNRMFILMGERREGKSLSLSLRIESDRRLEREMHILFYLDNDSAPITCNIVNQFRLIDQDGKCLSRLVDILLVHLIPGWNPCVDLPKKLDEVQSCYSIPTSEFSSVMSFYNLFEPAEDSNYFPHEFVKEEKVPPIKADDAIPPEMEALSISPTDDDVSIISMEVHDDKSSVRCSSMMDSMMTGMSRDESFSVAADDDDDDSDVRMELNFIDLQYREALNSINHRRQKAIEMVKSRAAERKRSLS